MAAAPLPSLADYREPGRLREVMTKLLPCKRFVVDEQHLELAFRHSVGSTTELPFHRRRRFRCQHFACRRKG